ncbi:MAG: nitroreductase family protein [Candidatus Hodarchaeales archaeon]|jgi:nitroreductase
MNETLNLIQNLRSIRNFSEKEIADSDLNTILDSAVRAATAGMQQSYSIVVVEDKEILKEFFYNANKALVFCVDHNRLVDTANQINQIYLVDSLEAFVTGSTDTVLAAQTATIAAKSLGIDSLLTNSIHRTNFQIYELLNLPERYCFPLISLCLGFPSKEPNHKKGRLRNFGIIHYNKYQKLSTEELNKIIKEYDKEENNLTFVEWKEMGFKHYLDWYFTKCFTPVDTPETKAIIDNFYTTLKKVCYL